jgi:polysaccharide biosynthesis protein PslF
MVFSSHGYEAVPQGVSEWTMPLFGEPTKLRTTPRKVALVGTYPPTECGIATFTANVRSALLKANPTWEVSVVRLVDDEPRKRPEGVARHWVRNFPPSLEEVVAYLNTCDVVIIQHEYGIYGGLDGDEVLDLVAALRVPSIATLHTILRHPSAHQRLVLQGLLDAVDLAIVPSRSALERLNAGYSARKSVVVPHGAASNFSALPSGDEAPIVLTWGLLGPGKGLEHAIEAVALVRPYLPNLRYVIAGRTHPKLCANGVDPYRESLKELVASLGVGDVVEFADGYRGWDALNALVRSATVVVLPYQSRDQISSGVLVEALAAGRPIVATRFPHAVELLSGGAGIVTGFDDVPALARALHAVISRPELAKTMAQRSRRVGQSLVWSRIGLRLGGLIDEISGRTRAQ